MADDLTNKSYSDDASGSVQQMKYLSDKFKNS